MGVALTAKYSRKPGFQLNARLTARAVVRIPKAFADRLISHIKMKGRRILLADGLQLVPGHKWCFTHVTYYSFAGQMPVFYPELYDI